MAAGVDLASLRTREVRGLGSGPDLRRGLWALGVGVRLRAGVLGLDPDI